MESAAEVTARKNLKTNGHAEADARYLICPSHAGKHAYGLKNVKSFQETQVSLIFIVVSK